MKMNAKALAGFALVMSGFLGGCSLTSSEPARPCPQLAILRPLERAQDHGQDAIHESTLVAVAQMQNIAGTCKYGDAGVSVNFTLDMLAQKGSRLGSSGRIGFPFFVTVLGKDEAVLSKELMTANFTFEGDKKTKSLSEPLKVFIPLSKGEDAAGYRILTGFQLTDEQLKASRQYAHENGIE